MRNRGWACGWGVAFVFVALTQQGCAEEDTGTDAVSTSQALNARMSYSEQCTPFAALQWHRAAFYARAVGASNAFEQCLRNSMQANYVPVGGDPNADLPEAQRIDAVLKMYADFNNHIVLLCNPDASGLSVRPLGTYPGYEERVIRAGIGGGAVAAGGYHEAEPDWGDYDDPGNEFMPWQWRAGDPLHEFSHNHGYMDGGVPDIVDQCAAAIVQQSHRQCATKATTFPGCTRDQLYLLDSWSGTSADAQSSATCRCTTDPLRLVSFRRQQNGRRLSAIGGGGREIRTNETISLGPWQTFF